MSSSTPVSESIQPPTPAACSRCRRQTYRPPRVPIRPKTIFSSMLMAGAVHYHCIYTSVLNSIVMCGSILPSSHACEGHSSLSHALLDLLQHHTHNNQCGHNKQLARAPRVQPWQPRRRLVGTMEKENRRGGGRKEASRPCHSYLVSIYLRSIRWYFEQATSEKSRRSSFALCVDVRSRPAV